MENTLLIKEWKEFIECSVIKFNSIDEGIASIKSGQDKWSNKEVLGHLCDSAINNYMRIMNLIITHGNCELQSYAQNEWVNNGAYQKREWKSIIDLWSSLNYSFIKLVESAPYNAWLLKGNYKNDSLSFEYLVADYVAHLKHHFSQISSD